MMSILRRTISKTSLFGNLQHRSSRINRVCAAHRVKTIRRCITVSKLSSVVKAVFAAGVTTTGAGYNVCGLSVAATATGPRHFWKCELVVGEL